MIESTTVPLTAFDPKGLVKDYAKVRRKWYGDDSLAHLIDGIQKYGDTPENFLADDVEGEQQVIVDAFVYEGMKAADNLCIHHPLMPRILRAHRILGGIAWNPYGKSTAAGIGRLGGPDRSDPDANESVVSREVLRNRVRPTELLKNTLAVHKVDHE